MNRIYFISGIDTGIGKTVATGLMARHLRSRGVDAITVKLVQTGNIGFSEDLEEHRRISGAPRCYEDELGLTSPQIFKFPSSPKLAAELEGKSVDLRRIEMCIDACSRSHEIVLVESAGGLDVPLDGDTLAVDFAAKRGWPLILVTCGRLGSLNHTLLSLEAARARKMPVAGVVYNWAPDVVPEIDRDTPETTKAYLAKWGFPPVIARIPRIENGAWPDIDFSEMFK
ncbi:MAG: dethiobiotin synthase [Kiritimatiellae bacterium]|nr:dethiobiotin synthase [Kiritimatiellia bacterium]